jgi:hypothetical protein
VVNTGGSATRFLNYDAWLNIGTVLDELLRDASSPNKASAMA